MEKNSISSEKLGILQFDSVFYKALLAIAIPVILQNLVGSMLNMVDNVMVGGLGEASIAAVGIANQIFFIFALVLFGINAGLSVFIAQFWGRKAFAEIRQAIGIGLIFSLVFSIIFTILAIMAPGMLIGIFTRDQEVIRLGSDYLSIVAWGYPLTAISMVYSVGLRSTEKPVYPLIASILSLLLNTVFNYLLIYGKFGFPMLGVRGAAIATVLARILEISLILGMVYRLNLVVSCRMKDFLRLDRHFITSILKIAAPIIANESLWVLGTSSFAVVYGRMGTDQLAAFNIVQTLDKIAFVAILGLGSACAVLVGKQIGEGRKDKAYVYGARSNIMAPIVGIIIGILIICVKNPILSLYNVSTLVKDYAGTLMILMACLTLIRSMNFTNLMGVLRAGGDVHFVLVFEAIPLWFFSVPLTIYTGLFLHWSLPVVFLISQSEEIVKCIAGLIRFFSKKWIHELNFDKREVYIEELSVLQ